MKKIWNVVKTAIEGLWEVVVLIWNVPVAIIELLWLLATDRERFKLNIEYLKGAIKDSLRK